MDSVNTGWPWGRWRLSATAVLLQQHESGLDTMQLGHKFHLLQTSARMPPSFSHLKKCYTGWNAKEHWSVWAARIKLPGAIYLNMFCCYQQLLNRRDEELLKHSSEELLKRKLFKTWNPHVDSLLWIPVASLHIKFIRSEVSCLRANMQIVALETFYV